MADTVVREFLAYAVILPLAAILTSMVVIAYLLYLVILGDSESSGDLSRLGNLVQRLKQDGKNITSVIRRFPRGGAIYVLRVTKQIKQRFLSHIYRVASENTILVDGDNLSFAADEESYKLVNKFNKPDEANKAEELKKPVKANICLSEMVENRDAGSNQQIILNNYDMNAIPPVLPSFDEFHKVSQVQQELEQYLEGCSQLERCFALGSHSAGVIQFYMDLAKLEKETLIVALSKAIMASKKIKDTISFTQQVAPDVEKIFAWSIIELNELDNKSQEEKKLFFEKFKNISLKVYNHATETYVALVEVTDAYWNYLPVELQEWLESYARQVFLNTYDFKFKQLFEEIFGKSDYAHQPSGIATQLVVSIFTAVEKNKSRPKLRLFSLFGDLNSPDADSSNFLRDTNLASEKTIIYKKVAPPWELVWGEASYEELIKKSKEKISSLNELDPKNDIEAQEQADVLKYLHE